MPHGSGESNGLDTAASSGAQLGAAVPHECGGEESLPIANDLSTQPGAVALHTSQQDENLVEVVTADYKTVKVAWHEVHNLNERLRKKLGVPPEWATEDEKIAFHEKQLALLKKADDAPRCEHVRADGTQCQGPKLRSGKKCYAHAQMEAARPQTLRLPPLEDANSVVLAVMEIQRALLDGLISQKTAGLLLYSVQIGAWAVRHATFRETEPGEMVRTARLGDRRDRKDRTHRGDAEARRRGETKKVLSQIAQKHRQECLCHTSLVAKAAWSLREVLLHSRGRLCSTRVW